MHIYFNKAITELEDQLQFIGAEFEVIQKRAEESHIILSKAYAQL